MVRDSQINMYNAKFAPNVNWGRAATLQYRKRNVALTTESVEKSIRWCGFSAGGFIRLKNDCP